MENVEKQIKETYYKAFFDKIDETINSKNPDYDWIVKLYNEIKNRLLYYIKKDSNTYKHINNSFDSELFEQMIRNDVFDQVSLFNLVNNTFNNIKSLQAPERDTDLEKAKERVFNAPNDKKVSTFIKETHILLDTLDDDMKSFFDSIEKI